MRHFCKYRIVNLMLAYLKGHIQRRLNFLHCTVYRIQFIPTPDRLKKSRIFFKISNYKIIEANEFIECYFKKLSTTTESS